MNDLLAHTALQRQCNRLNRVLKDGVALTFLRHGVDLLVTEIHPIDHQTLQVHTRCHRDTPFIVPLAQASRLLWSRAQPQILGITFIPWSQNCQDKKEQKNDRRSQLHHRPLGGNYIA